MNDHTQVTAHSSVNILSVGRRLLQGMGSRVTPEYTQERNHTNVQMKVVIKPSKRQEIYRNMLEHTLVSKLVFHFTVAGCCLVILAILSFPEDLTFMR